MRRLVARNTPDLAAYLELVTGEPEELDALVRDILTEKLLGPKDMRGTGLIPVDSLLRIVPQPGVPDGVEAVFVQHKSGGVSRLGFKSYDQGRLSFQGTEQDFIWLDEEPPFTAG